MLPFIVESMIQAAMLAKLALTLSSLYSKNPASQIILLLMKIRQDPPSLACT
jgi:hypothetical protein